MAVSHVITSSDAEFHANKSTFEALREKESVIPAKYGVLHHKYPSRLTCYSLTEFG